MTKQQWMLAREFVLEWWVNGNSVGQITKIWDGKFGHVFSHGYVKSVVRRARKSGDPRAVLRKPGGRPRDARPA